MPRAWVWVQVLAGWLPVWVLYTALIVAVHGQDTGQSVLAAARAVAPAAFLGIVVHRFTRRVPWPRPFRISFVLLHLGAAAVYSLSWFALSNVVEMIVRRAHAMIGAPLLPFLVLGVWLYAIVAGISYAIEGTERAARAETAAARTQLDALRAQLHPHFLFNALHTVVQLIPTQPALAADAAEQVAALLRTTLEEDRDVVALADEWAFVSRYLDVERLRFGDRLRVRAEIDDDVRDVPVPSFALQTLVENAVRHGAAPRVAPTDIVVSARRTGDALTLVVRDTGDGDGSLGNGDDGGGARGNGTARGTGLARLRERLVALYGDAGRLSLATSPAGGCEATLVIPRRVQEDA